MLRDYDNSATYKHDLFFDTQSEYYALMIDALREGEASLKKRKQPFERHHVVFRSVVEIFSGMSFVESSLRDPWLDDGNVVDLPIAYHYKVHYYAWKCAREDFGCRSRALLTIRFLAKLDKVEQSLSEDDLQTLLTIQAEIKKNFRKLKEREEDFYIKKEKKNVHVYEKYHRGTDICRRRDFFYVYGSRENVYPFRIEEFYTSGVLKKVTESRLSLGSAYPNNMLTSYDKNGAWISTTVLDTDAENNCQWTEYRDIQGEKILNLSVELGSSTWDEFIEGTSLSQKGHKLICEILENRKKKYQDEMIDCDSIISFDNCSYSFREYLESRQLCIHSFSLK